LPLKDTTPVITSEKSPIISLIETIDKTIREILKETIPRTQAELTVLIKWLIRERLCLYLLSFILY